MENGNGSIPDQLPKSRGVKSLWLKDAVTEDDRKERLAQLYNNSALFDDLRNILTGLYEDSKQRARKASGSDNWATTIVAEQRYREALEDIHRLLPDTNDH